MDTGLDTAPSRPGLALPAYDEGVSLLTIVKVGKLGAPPSVGQWGRVKAECYAGANFEAIPTDRGA